MGLSQIPLLPWLHCHAARLPEPSCWLVGRQERSAPAVLPPRGTSYGTASPPHTPHTHTYSLQPKGQAMLGHGPPYTI